MVRSRWSHPLGLLVTGGLVVGACSGSSSGDPATSDEARATIGTEVESTADEFTEVSVADEAFGDETVSTADESTPGTVVDSSSATDPAATTATDRSETTEPASEDSNPPDVSAPTTAVASSVADGPADTIPTDAPTGSAADDRALAAALTADFDEDDEAGLGDVFDTVCLGRELVVAFGGAEAAATKYDITVDTVNSDGDVLDSVVFEEADAEAIVEGFGRCGSFDELLLLSLTGSAGDDLDAQCIVEALPDGFFEDVFLADLQGREDESAEAFDDAFDNAFVACLG